MGRKSKKIKWVHLPLNDIDIDTNPVQRTARTNHKNGEKEPLQRPDVYKHPARSKRSVTVQSEPEMVHSAKEEEQLCSSTENPPSTDGDNYWSPSYEPEPFIHPYLFQYPAPVIPYPFTPPWQELDPWYPSSDYHLFPNQISEPLPTFCPSTTSESTTATSVYQNAVASEEFSEKADGVSNVDVEQQQYWYPSCPYTYPGSSMFQPYIYDYPWWPHTRGRHRGRRRTQFGGEGISYDRWPSRKKSSNPEHISRVKVTKTISNSLTLSTMNDKVPHKGNENQCSGDRREIVVLDNAISLPEKEPVFKNFPKEKCDSMEDLDEGGANVISTDLSCIEEEDVNIRESPSKNGSPCDSFTKKETNGSVLYDSLEELSLDTSSHPKDGDKETRLADIENTNEGVSSMKEDFSAGNISLKALTVIDKKSDIMRTEDSPKESLEQGPVKTYKELVENSSILKVNIVEQEVFTSGTEISDKSSINTGRTISLPERDTCNNDDDNSNRVMQDKNDSDMKENSSLLVETKESFWIDNLEHKEKYMLDDDIPSYEPLSHMHSMNPFKASSAMGYNTNQQMSESLVIANTAALAATDNGRLTMASENDISKLDSSKSTVDDAMKISKYYQLCSEDVDDSVSSPVLCMGDEIVVHEADDDISECGSEDVEMFGHRYEMTTEKRYKNNPVSLAAELLSTKQDIPYDRDFKPLVVSEEPGCYTNTQALEEYYGEMPRSGKVKGTSSKKTLHEKDILDSGIHTSDEDTDETERKNVLSEEEEVLFSRNTAGNGFGYQQFGTQSRQKEKKTPITYLKNNSPWDVFCCKIM